MARTSTGIGIHKTVTAPTDATLPQGTATTVCPIPIAVTARAGTTAITTASTVITMATSTPGPAGITVVTAQASLACAATVSATLPVPTAR